MEFRKRDYFFALAVLCFAGAIGYWFKDVLDFIIHANAFVQGYLPKR